MRSLVVLSTTALAIGLAFTAGCGDAAPRSAERFCGELAAHVQEITTPPVKAETIPALITLFSKMGEVAPLEVEADWEAVYQSLKTAVTTNVSDPASVQLAADAAYASQKSAQKVAAWAQENCGIDLGPVASAPGGVDVAPPPTETAPAG